MVTGRNERVPLLPTGEHVSPDANEDILRFFQERFAEVAGPSFPQWPGKQVLHDLTVQAAGLFIWAEIVMKVLEQGLPDYQLELVLGGDLGEQSYGVMSSDS